MNAIDRMQTFIGEPTAQDPVLAAIEAHRVAWEKAKKASSEFFAVQEALSDELRVAAAGPMIRVNGTVLFSKEQIDRYVDQQSDVLASQHGGRNGEPLKKERALYHRLMDEQERKVMQLRRQLPENYDALRERHDRADNEVDQCFEEVLRLRATSIAGAAAQARFVLNFVIHSENDAGVFIEPWLKSFAENLDAMAEHTSVALSA